LTRISGRFCFYRQGARTLDLMVGGPTPRRCAKYTPCVPLILHSLTRDLYHQISCILCHSAQIRSYRTSVKYPQITPKCSRNYRRTSEIRKRAFYEKQRKTLFHACAVTRRLEKALCAERHEIRDTTSSLLISIYSFFLSVVGCPVGYCDTV